MKDASEIARWLAALADTLSLATDADDLEQRFLDFSRQVILAPSAGIYVLKPHTLAVQGVATYGVSDFFLARYEDVGRENDPILQQAIKDKVAVDNRDLMTDAEWRSSPLYREVLHLHSFDFIVQAPVICGDEFAGVVIFASTDEWAGRALLRVAATAIGRIVGAALVSLRTREAAERHRDQVVRALDLMSEAVVVTDSRTGQRHHNRRARRLLQELETLGVDHFDDLIVDRSNHDGLTAVELPVAQSDRGEIRLSVQSVVADDDESTTISLLSLRASGTLDLPEIYTRLLTPREHDVAALVVHGSHDAEIARSLNISPHTVKQYLKSVYRKLGVGSRVELVRLVLVRGLDDSDSRA